MSTYRPLTVHEYAALKRFAESVGRNWKHVLRNEFWPYANIWRDPKLPLDNNTGHLLHGLRNSHGPSWLAGFRFTH